MRSTLNATWTTTFAVTGLAIGAGAAVASIPTADGVIHACYKNTAGEVRIVEADNNCKSTEQPLSWSQRGPAGPAGLAGPAGPTGQAGRDGVPGGAIPARLQQGTLVSLAATAAGTSIAECSTSEYLVQGGYEVGYPGTGRSGTLTDQAAFDRNGDGILDSYRVGVRNTSEGELIVSTHAWCATTLD